MADVVGTASDYDHGVLPPNLLAMDTESTASLPTTDSYSASDDIPKTKGPVPIAICSMATRLPGGISSAEQLWEFLLNKRDGCARIPPERYTTGQAREDATSNGEEQASGIDSEKPHWKTHGYMLDHVDLAAFDSALFSMTRAELAILDPQQRILLELTRECFESAGETSWRGKDVGVYIGTFGEDWNDLQYHDRQDLHLYKLTGAGDFVLSNRISYEYDLKGPSLVLRTGCSASLYGLHLACQALQTGEIPSALVGGCNMIMNPSKVETMFNVGVLSKGASSRSFDADADGYARAEAVSMIYVKRLDDALRDGNPIRAIIRSTASNCDGKTPGLTKPSREAHETLIRASYAAAGLENELHRTGFFECHATGTSSGDPEEAKAVADVFGQGGGVYIGSVKPNLGHSEGASGLTSLLKCIMALENKIIPPNIKFQKPNPNIPFEEGGLRVPTEPIPWPQDRDERASINSFGVGGANAHVIIDSAAEFGIGGTAREAPRGNRLVVFTANDLESARRGSQECSSFITNHLDKLNDAAYTLGKRREHLPYRTFAVVDSANNKDVVFSTPAKTNLITPKPVFIFTGQGAQWPTMGAALLSEYPTAMHDLKVMEQALATLGQDLAPNWSLSEELLRPKESSQVYKAEFSQPLCTAVQMMVVNILRDWGVMPAAVLGHSSGEIAAAYASSALTMQEAIISAYLRGRVTKGSTDTPGAMAAIGLGSSDIQPYLVDGIVIACENSPSNTTLSGDEDKVVQVIEAVKADHPDVIARRLQVDMAYHSHHMKKIGEQYEQQLSPYVSSKPARVPFFSTVTGNMAMGDSLDASYWRSNLESPVLFNTGVKELLEFQGHNVILVEVGPHSALSGPLRQILSHLKAQQALYLPTLMRSQDDSVALLNTVGQLFCKGLRVRFDYINPPGRVLHTLPSYPWNHETRYWYESRVSREYRGRHFPHHPIIGSRVVEVSPLEPTWRNMLRLDTIPWCQDHKIGSDVVFPGTGYLAMAAEAMRQLSGAEDVSLRQITIASALLLGPEPTEVILSMRPQKLTNSLDSSWYEFSLSSYDELSNSWTKHCFGHVKAGGGNIPERTAPIAHLPREVEPAYWYKAMRSVGLNYGPQFQGLGRISTHLMQNVAIADLRLDAVAEPEPQDHAVYYFHPASSDACMQLLSAAASRGQARSFHRKAVPTYIGEAYFKGPQGTVTVEAAADVLPNGAIVGTCIGADSTNAVVMQLKDVKLTPLDDGDAPVEDTHAGGRVLWQPDIDFQDASQLLHSHKEVREAYFRLQRLVLLCCISAQDDLNGKDIPVTEIQPHLTKYREWVSEQVRLAKTEGYPLLSAAEVSELLQLSPEARPDRIAEYLQLVLETEYATIGKTVHRIYESLSGILSGEVDGLEILRQDDALAEIYGLGNQWDYGPWLRLLSHRTPHLRILEIGAGTGATTDVVLRGLDTFYSYTYTDVSAGFFPAAKERFGQFGPRMQFQTLDIASDPLEQGFAANSFDLIIAANVLHVTPNIGETLANVRKLLRPTGKLLLQEMYMTVKWLNFIMGPLPGWWLGEEDGRSQEPYVSPERWAQELLAAGFLAPEASIFDDQVPFQANVTMVSSPDITLEASPPVYLLSGNPEGEIAMNISASLRNLGLQIENIGLSDKPQGFVISILDLEGRSFLQNISLDKYARFRDFLSELTELGMLWLSKPSQINCSDPQYSAILGFLRVVRNETGASLCTLELDDIKSAKAWQTVVQVYQKIRKTRAVERDDLADPDCEFAYSDGIIYLPRFRWISVSDELTAQPEVVQTYKRLEIGKRGSLKSLQWVERPLRDDLTGEEVYVDIRAVGMNFKDTLIAMGVINGPTEAGDGFGVECSGVIRAVGPDVTDFVVGERVMAITSDAYATTTRTAASRCIKMPDDLSFEEAASMPCVYPTVIHGLINLARLEKGQTVLIHSACGGIGIAAMHICNMLGIDKIYATVGSAEKVQYLMDTFGLPRSHIFSSRDDSFLAGIMRETMDCGVDVVLNSLSGELLHASWKCVAEFGSMVEIGKRDFIGQGRLDMESFEGNRAFFGIEMWPIITKQPHRIRKLSEQFMGYYRTGVLKPIQPIRVFDAADIEPAIRTMQKGQHIGKLVVRIPEDTSSIGASPARQKLTLRADASYLLVGGLGGLGRSIAMWMVENGAKNLIFISRSGGTKPHEIALLKALEGSGCTADVVMGSVTELDSVVRAVEQARAPIAGVIQLSMVLRDHLFADMPFEDWEAVIQPKIEGTWNLHNALARQSLDFFVLFSSFAGLIGQRGQANYASASTFLDAFVQFRHRIGLPASVLDVGAVADVGFVAERPDLIQFFKTTSHYFLQEQDVLDSVELAIKKSKPSLSKPNGSFVSDSQIALAMRSTIPLSSPQNRNVWRRDARLSLYHTLEAEAGRDGAAAGETTGTGDNDEDAEIRRLLAAAEADLSIVTQDTFTEQLAQRIGVAFFNFMMKSIEELDINAPFASLGIDSLVAIEVRNWLRLSLGIELSVLEIMRSESLLALAKFGAKKWASKLAAK
ncbi:putative polyketide synthase [Rosellinia necatrix]|uniref:Putative polyketide synthase n=1 Tax=Rosellinia necatrix TaxID=77044 RepID=A0A1W2TIX9_ROSNE|nr:putative polyketide synthase [Rosellinia necatrix]